MGMTGINNPGFAPRDKSPSTLDRVFQGVELATKILGTGADIYTGVKQVGNMAQANKLKGTEQDLEFAKSFKAAAPADITAGKAEDVKNYPGKWVAREKPETAIDLIMKSYALDKSKTEGQKSAIELGKLQKEQQLGKQLSDNEIKNLSEAANIPGMLNDINKTVEENSDFFGPVAGRAVSLNPYDTKAQLIQSKMATGAQLIGKYMEGGVLRAEDVPKYQKMLPQLSDTAEVAKGKAAAVQKMIRDKYNLTKQALKDSGFNTEAFDKSPLKDLPDPFNRAETKDIGGVKYQRVEGGWKKVQ